MSYGSTGSSPTRETTRLLAESAALSRNNEDIASNVGNRLRSQRELLETTKGHMHSMRQLSASASEAIREIESKSKKRKVYLWSIIVILFFVNILLIYLRWTSRSKW